MQNSVSITCVFGNNKGKTFLCSSRDINKLTEGTWMMDIDGNPFIFSTINLNHNLDKQIGQWAYGRYPSLDGRSFVFGWGSIKERTFYVPQGLSSI